MIANRLKIAIGIGIGIAIGIGIGIGIGIAIAIDCGIEEGDSIPIATPTPTIEPLFPRSRALPGNVGLGGSASCAAELETTQLHPHKK